MQIPECLDDMVFLEQKIMIVRIYSESNMRYQSLVYYCPKCKSYLSNEGKMEKDINKVALEYMQNLPGKARYDPKDKLHVKVRRIVDKK